MRTVFVTYNLDGDVENAFVKADDKEILKLVNHPRVMQVLAVPEHHVLTADGLDANKIREHKISSVSPDYILDIE